MRNTISTTLTIITVLALLTAGCRKREAQEANNYVVFETSAQGLAAIENSIVVKIRTQSGVNTDIPVDIKLSEAGVNYGIDYITEPAAVAEKVSVTIPSGNNEASFILTKMPGVLLDGDEKIVFDLYNSGSPVIIGATRRFTLNFSEIVASTSALTINGGGALFPNKVFIDISANRQTVVQRTTWDLGFYTGAEDFRVILNSSSAMMAKQINKNDLNTVTAADTVGFSVDVAFNQFAPVTTSLPYIDYPDGDLSKTAIASVSAVASDNKVYIVNRGTGTGNPAPLRGWKKIRVLRNAIGGYTLQYADIDATAFSTLDIAKDDTYFFKYASFDNAVVEVEPPAKKWDFAWTYFSNVTNFGSGEVPYLFQDIILINRNVSIARVMVSTKPFANFGEADIPAQVFMTAQNAIGADWRSGGGPGTSPAVRTDRYYIIKDGDNNYYKIRFTSLTQNGERGYPSFEAVWLKQG